MGVDTQMKSKRVFSIALLSASFLIGRLSFAPEDELQKNLQEQSTAGQENKPKELQRDQNLENIRRQNDIDRLQQDLDRIKRQHPQLSPAERTQALEIQRQLDQLRNDQQLQRLKNQQELERIQREPDRSRLQQQLDELQRRQRIDSLQDQLRRNQVERDLNRLQQQPILRPGLGPILRPGRR
ncbi:MAG TPA: hypothetical protein VIE89_32810 [Candidatus Binatia bacterium]